MRPCPSLILVAALAACSQFPDLDAAIDAETRAAPYPDLVPLETLDARMGGFRITPDGSDAIAARADGLEARTRGQAAVATPDRARIADLRARAEALRRREIE